MKIATKNLQQIHSDSVKTQLDNKPYTTIDLMVNLIKSDRFKQDVETIRSLTKEQAKPYKARLPAFFAVDFKSDNAVIRDIKSNTGILIFDIDVYDLDDCVLKTISELPQTVFCFRSPSNGIKFGVQTNYTGTDNNTHKAIYKAVATLLERKGIVCEIDEQTCNINRMCYLSHDSNVYFNANPDKLNVSRLIEKAEKQTRENQQKAREYMASLPDKTRYQQAIAEQKERLFLSTVAPRNRDKPIFVFAIELYKCGFTQTEVEYKLTEHHHLMGDHNPKHKAQSAFERWKADGCEIYKPKTITDLSKVK